MWRANNMLYIPLIFKLWVGVVTWPFWIERIWWLVLPITLFISFVFVLKVLDCDYDYIYACRREFIWIWRLSRSFGVQMQYVWLQGCYLSYPSFVLAHAVINNRKFRWVFWCNLPWHHFLCRVGQRKAHSLS